MIPRLLTRFMKIPKAIGMIPSCVRPLMLMTLISAQMADNLKVSKYIYGTNHPQLKWSTCVMRAVTDKCMCI